MRRGIQTALFLLPVKVKVKNEESSWNRPFHIFYKFYMLHFKCPEGILLLSQGSWPGSTLTNDCCRSESDEDINRDYHGFYEFTFRRFFDDGHPGTTSNFDINFCMVQHNFTSLLLLIHHKVQILFLVSCKCFFSFSVQQRSPVEQQHTDNWWQRESKWTCLCLAASGCQSQKNPRRSVHAEAQVDKTTSRRKPVDLLLGPLRNVDGSLVKAIMQDVSWVGEWWMMMIQNEITMWVFVNNMTFTFRRSDCDSKKASDNKSKGGRG